jgi:hypothetical protein
MTQKDAWKAISQVARTAEDIHDGPVQDEFQRQEKELTEKHQITMFGAKDLKYKPPPKEEAEGATVTA